MIISFHTIDVSFYTIDSLTFPTKQFSIDIVFINGRYAFIIIFITLGFTLMVGLANSYFSNAAQADIGKQ
jgi:hypothetical protein